MIKIKVQSLSLERFFRFGRFVDMLHPEQYDKIGRSPGGFYRDMAQVSLGCCSEVSFSVSHVRPKPLEVCALEYHNHTGEGMMPLDGDVVICFAPATAADDVPLDRVEAFLVPSGTLVTIRPGVWHCAAFPLGDEALNVMIALPERVYQKDCEVVRLSPEDSISIER